MQRTWLVFLLPCFISPVFCAAQGLPPGVVNTQPAGDAPPTPLESLAKITVPEGFKVTLFAGEPDVCQPIGMALDDRGRLWVAECFSYPQWQQTGKDRILIFEDTDGDGRFDRRKVFWDKANNLSGLAVGFGGVWACCAPNLLFLADANGDDRPDGEPQVVIDGWDTAKVGHNIYNGLEWGPDGWLYGCHGIKADSKLGKPGTPDNRRVWINCGIWRYHPTREIVEAIAHGTTNPWGLDFDEHGQGFFTNCVIGHLWYLIPGAHYQRMYGQDYNPHAYDLIASTSDHLHWGGGKWQDSRGGQGVHNEAGGGHAHVGAMIYLGDNWPDRYRNTLFTCNIHGNRLNNDLLVRDGGGFVGRHAPDFMHANDPWFRGIGLRYGPDGGVYVSDWTDLGECHDNDGVHRSSGRIYKVVYGQPSTPTDVNLARLGDEDLISLQLHKNDWYVRQARRILQERAAEGRDMSAVYEALLEMFANETDVPRKLRAMWALYVTGGAGPKWLLAQLDHPDEYVRGWAVRLLCDGQEPPSAAVGKFAALAAEDKSAHVRLMVASALQRVPPEGRWSIAQGLVSHPQDDMDRNLPLMIWYGIEPAVPLNKSQAIKLAAAAKISLVRQFIAKRLAAASE